MVSGPGRGTRSGRRRVALGLVARLAPREPALLGGPLLGRTAARPGVALRQRFFGEADLLELQHDLAESRRAAPRGDDVRVFVVERASNKSFSTSSAPRLLAIVSSSASETVRLSERYTLLARSASETTRSTGATACCQS